MILLLVCVCVMCVCVCITQANMFIECVQWGVLAGSMVAKVLVRERLGAPKERAEVRGTLLCVAVAVAVAVVRL